MEIGNLKKSLVKVPSIKKGTKIFSLIGLKIWKSLTDGLKSAKTLSSLKSKINDFGIKKSP